MKWLVLLLAIVCVVLFLMRQPDDSKLKKAQHTADSLLVEAPKWTQERADSQRVLDSLTRLAEASRKHLAQLEDFAKTLKRKRDSLATVRRELAARLDTAQATPVGPTPSDTAARALLLLDRARRIIGTMSEEIQACEQGDGLWERRETILKDQIGNCEHRAATLGQQLGVTQARLDVVVGALDTLRQAERAGECHYLVTSGPCLELVAFGGVNTSGGVVGLGVALPIKRLHVRF
jgi:hypothetical protein